MVVVATESMSSMQLTTVPFRSLFTGLIIIIDTRDRTFGPESLEKVNVEVPIVSGRGIPLIPSAVTGDVLWVTFSGKTINSHLCSIVVPDMVLQVSSS